MPAPTSQAELRVLVDPDRLTADVLVPVGFPPAMLTPSSLSAVLQASGVQITPEVERAVNQSLSDPAPIEGDRLLKLARATPPQHGTDGRIDWQLDINLQDNAELSFYDRTSFINVKQGQLLARVVQPTEGRDGRDVLGNSLPARAGKQVSLIGDDTVVIRPGGEVLAQRDGVLFIEPGKVSVRNIVEVPEYVDFNTGNIEVQGDVLVRKGVRDCFIIKAGGNVEVHGLVEAATIQCGRDFRASGGMAGRGSGGVEVGGNLLAKYLDSVIGRVRGDLIVQREIINSNLCCEGDVRAEHGAVIGGRLLVTGSLVVGHLGSAAGVPTELLLGRVPRLEPFHQRLTAVIEGMKAQCRALTDERDQINSGTRVLTAQHKERQTEIAYELSWREPRLRDAQVGLDVLNERMLKLRRIDVLIERKLFPGVLLSIGDRTYKVIEEHRGPLRIQSGLGREPVVRRGEDLVGALSSICDIHAAVPHTLCVAPPRASANS